MNTNASLGIPVNSRAGSGGMQAGQRAASSIGGAAAGGAGATAQQSTLAAAAASQHQQRLLLQQRMRQQQAQQQNFEHQIFQLLMTLNRKPKRLYQFTEDTDAILRKYEQFKPSFEFHIYENNYKICAPANARLQQHQRTPGTNDGLILNKSNETLKEFLEYVARGIIPEAIVEVLRDCNVQFYEGCLILQVYDHTNTVDVKQPQGAGAKTDQPAKAGAAAGAAAADQGPPEEHKLGGSSKDATGKERVTTLKRPRMYRTLLRPNDLTRYYDMLSWADHTRFSDSVYQQLEAEILAITKRNLRLDTHLNPFEHADKLTDDEFLQPHWDEEQGRMAHPHRPLSTASLTRGAVGHIEQHEELPQHTSAYEQMMLIMSGRTTTTTTATLAASLAKRAEMMGTSSSTKTGGSTGSGSSASGTNSVAAAAVAAAAVVGSGANNENNQFSRLKFVEQFRLNKEKKKQQALNANLAPPGYNHRISMSTPLTTQPVKQQAGAMLQNVGPGGMGMGSAHTAPSEANGKRAGTADSDDKSKPKRQRKPTKKADGAAVPKKRVTKKQQAAAAATLSNPGV
ncbi:AGR401Wp [Eremothecium gossypii ATCC 10895]|uniref:AGR401Wp n=1 Tax=Eremothecium gossypii (strain ATCC 10895 / CBS 109.51 / FGSC 9923 / NRRL Y-1056) TaxID=284811 RepID=Q74Z06_EREGS|nr:AGR401Wp [Eremothecium gossypii ATCC 10895]AAS54891.1 AGR401Wp [Eremothecium gossypii ATCC 10895]AEY99223.1 FAGR401Wp [Eremothecium gossypii FDAG1]